MTTISVDQPCCLTVSKPQACPVNNDQPTGLLVDREVNKIVECKLGTNNFHLLKWNLNPLGKTNGFLGQYFSLSVTIKIDDKLKTLKFFAKAPPPVDNPQYQFLMRFNTFNKEIAVYDEVYSRLGKGYGSKWRPEYYFGKNKVIMVLEDVGLEGYVMPNKYVDFDEEHCICVARALSMLHSRSLIMDEKLRRSSGRTLLDIYGHLLNEVLFEKNDEKSQKFLSASVEGAHAMVDRIEEIKDEERQPLKDRIVRWSKEIFQMLERSTKFRNVLCHRDVWANNLMLKYNAAGRPVGCCLIDFQFLRYCPPANDFTLFLYLTTNRAIRDQCFEKVARIYHELMRQQLAAEDLEIEDCLPWMEFHDSIIETKKLALTYALFNVPIMLLTREAVEENFGTSDEDTERVLYGNKRQDLIIHQFCTVPAYKSRLTEIILEIKDF